METTPKDIWGKAEETNQQRLAASEPGDEIVISRLDENKKQVKQTFVNITKNYFKEVQVLCGPHEEQKQIKAVGKIWSIGTAVYLPKKKRKIWIMGSPLKITMPSKRNIFPGK